MSYQLIITEGTLRVLYQSNIFVTKLTAISLQLADANLKQNLI